MATTAPAATRRLCLNCDNRHGCRSAQPACLTLRRAASERLISGQQLMIRRGLLQQCAACELFRRCWNSETYRRQQQQQLEPELPPEQPRRIRPRRRLDPVGGGEQG